ncbi:MAG TPA: alpha/beta hydrolase [Stellaceae bacterium]|nr:alpha/beta hydrolase [Stellaceae bacterium]
MRRLLHRQATGLAALLLLLFAALPLQAQEKPARQPRDAHETHDAAKASAPSPAPAPSLLPADAVTHHKLKLGNQEIAYTATAGTLPLRDDKGEKQADIFYVAFLRDGVADGAKRPITYAFNGGPGAAAAYLDIGALGPRALDFGAAGKPEPAVDHVGDNPDSWLPFTDLVFIDPVGAGYSRAAGGTDGAKKFWSVRADLDALAQIIRLHLTRADRLNSPVYLVGESYGGFRAARLAHQLANQEGIAAAGVMLISPALEFRLMSGDEFDVLPWALRLPSYAAVALEAKGALSAEGLAEVEHFALNDYLVALTAGAGDAKGSERLYATIADFIGLDAGTVARWRGRVPTGVYIKEMRRPDGQILSRYDGSIAGADPSPHSYQAEEDPVLQGSIAPFTRAFLAYARNELGFSTEIGYELLNNDVSRHWEWGDGGRQSLGSADALRRALALQPRLRVLIAHGLTDLITPYMTSRYVVDHLPANLTASRVELKLYAGGHMMYLRSASRHRLHDDAEAFYLAEAAQ